MSESEEPPLDEPDMPFAHAPTDLPKEPTSRAPVGACDAHVHMVAGPDEYSLWDGRSEDPAPGFGFEDWLSRYRAHLDTLGFTRGVIVQSILYGTDNSVTIEALRRLGNQFCGVALVTDEVLDGTLDRLAEHRIRAVRLNCVHGGVLSWDGARAMAPRLADRGMHVEMLVHADQRLGELHNEIAALEVPVVIDHAGWPSDGGSDSAGIRALCRLLAEERVWVKLSGIYRFSPPPYASAAPLIRALVEANPNRCVWGSDWPHLMLGAAKMPDAGVLFDFFTETVESPELRQRILVDNPAKLYQF